MSRRPSSLERDLLSSVAFVGAVMLVVAWLLSSGVAVLFVAWLLS
jgi:hypothetical protein